MDSKANLTRFKMFEIIFQNKVPQNFNNVSNKNINFYIHKF